MFSILIRTLVRDNDGWHLGVGGGIVADSRASREIAEMNEKIAVFKDALGR
jgi:anthranilate/para-aminobenzoate synthase component I